MQNELNFASSISICGARNAYKFPYKNGYVLRLWCSDCCTCASCTYVQNMCKLLPYLIYVQHVCYLCTQHVLLAHMHATGMLHKCFLHVCMLQRAAYMPLAHMQATSVPHMCSLHTCMLLQCCINAAYTHASY